MSTKKKFEIHPTDIYSPGRCYYLKKIYNNFIELNRVEGNKYCRDLKKQIEENCQPMENEFNKRYKYDPEVEKFGIDIDDNEECRLFKMWFNLCKNPEECKLSELFRELLNEC